MANKSLLKIVGVIFCLVSVLGSGFFSQPALAGFELVKTKTSDRIYYIDGRGNRHPFPDKITYESWYGKDYSLIATVEPEVLAKFPIAKNITIRPGTYLVKIKTAPQVYAIETGGVLREIENEDIAEQIYGKNWAKRVVDIEDIFFQNYTLGEPIIHDYSIPDGSLFQDKKTKKYYYKNNDIIQPFDFVKAVLANRFDLTMAVNSPWSYTVRERPIVGLDQTVFNPVAKPLNKIRDCENKKLKAAVIFLADKDFNNEEIGKVETIKKEISDRFAYVTGELSNIDVSYPTVIMTDDGYLIKKRNDGLAEVKNEVINTFYDKNEDIFDFIFVWTNFRLTNEQTNEIAHFVPVTNRLDGVGKGNFDWSQMYGSSGKLKGIIMMGNVAKYQPKTQAGLDEALNIVMHEILHNWAAYINFTDSLGQPSQALLRPDDFKHWSYYAGFISPIGGSGWIDNGNGTFTSGLSLMANTNLRQYSQLDLYLMGLIPSQLVSPIMYVKPKFLNEVGNTISGQAKYITIDQIIDLNGKVQCSAN